ncbi:MAG TPA: hypothetical protein VGO11_23330 [Chthoniobacteraceae bacterium]|jgi:hypothetical protein|nr:hypothetical protein [Chthoniobacteraceae bacterium]
MTRFLQTILWCSLLALLGGSERASALEAQQLFAPIKIVSGARTLKDMRATHQAWAERVLIEPMRQRTAGKPWQEAAVHFAQRTAFVLLPSNDIGDAPELRDEANRVEGAGGRDPLIFCLCLRLRREPATYDPA